MPALLAIVVGSTLAAANLLLRNHSGLSWAVPIYLVLTGLFLVRRTWFGTGLLVVGLTGLLINKIGVYFEHGMNWTFYAVVKDFLGFLFLASMVAAVKEQVNYLKSRVLKENPEAEQTMDVNRP